MAADLWEAALNAEPRALARLCGDKDRIAKLAGAKQEPYSGGGTDSDAGETRKPQDSKKISLERVARIGRGDFNLSSHMGTLLKEGQRFDSLFKIRAAYSVAFADSPKDAASPDLDKTLAHNCLDALSLVRNIIVHKAGVADQEYLDERRRRARTAPELELGQALELDGQITRDLFFPVLECGVDLIEAVEAVLQAKANDRASAPDA